MSAKLQRAAEHWNCTNRLVDWESQEALALSIGGRTMPNGTNI